MAASNSPPGGGGSGRLRGRLLTGGGSGAADGRGGASKDALGSWTRRMATEAELERLFRRLDTKNTGDLDRDEIRAALAEQGLPCSKATVADFFRSADVDGDARISLEEFKTFVMRQEKALRTVYDAIDHNGDGRICTGELRSGAAALGFRLTSEQSRDLILKADTDNDGVISFEEWSRILRLLPTINPFAVFEAFGATMMVDHADGEKSPPIELPPKRRESALLRGEASPERPAMLALLASKLYSGGVAGATSRTLTAPIDRLKMMMQAAPPGEPSKGMAEGMRAIYREGGAPAFFRGNSVNVLKIAPETAIKFLAFDQLKSAIATDPDAVTMPERFAAGGGAGALSQAAIYPLEICKTRMAVSAPGVYSGIFDCLRSVVRAEGLGALYQGLGASVIGIVPYAGVDLSVNSMLKDVVGRRYADRGAEPGVSVVLGCGMLSSTCGMLVTYPLGLIRTRLQASGMPGAPKFDGALDCFRQTLRAGGVAGLFQGLVPNMLKVLPATSISYAIYDLLSR